MAKTTNDFVNRAIENIIEPLKMGNYDSSKKTIDYKPGDVVKCNYMSGLFTIYSIIDEDYLLINSIVDRRNFETVKVGFLEKVETNNNTLKVLF